MQTNTNNRSYNQHCGLAYALDIIGERWTLLIIRELVAGPRRYKDLVDGLPGISTNLLSERLKYLEQQDAIRHRTLSPPAGSAVYELTPVGQALEPMLIELGKWGSQFVPPLPEAAGDGSLLRLGSYALTLKTFFRPERAQGINATYELRVGDEVLQAQIKDGALHVQQGDALRAHAVFHTDIESYLGLLTGELEPEDAIERGVVRVEGEPGALERFLEVCGMSGATPRDTSGLPPGPA
jgi:DNA-binding HxlR family transcriptional regulator